MKGKAISCSKTEKVKAVIILLRPYYVTTIVPFLMLFGTVFAGSANFSIFSLATICPMLILFACHLDNAVSDFKRGIDRLSGGSRSKLWDSACRILPSGTLSPNLVSLFSLLLYMTGLLVGIFIAFYSTLWFLVPLVMGLTSAFFYNRFSKYKGLGEVTLFVGTLGVPIAGYVVVAQSLTPDACLIFIIPTLFIVTFFTFHQFFDTLTDSNRRIQNLACYLHASSSGLVYYLIFNFFTIVIYHNFLISIGILDPKTFLSILTTPIMFFAVIETNQNINRAWKLCNITLFVYLSLMMAGQLMYSSI